MKINNDTIVNVYNYGQNRIAFDTKVQKYTFSAADEINGEPSVNPMSAIEIKQLNSTGRMFKDGDLFFEEEVEADVYKYIGITDWNKIYKPKEIMAFLLDGSKESLQKLIDIDSYHYFEHVNGICYALKQNDFNISLRTTKVVEQRKKELRRNIRVSKIVLQDVEEKPNIYKEELEQKEQKINEQQEQIDDMLKQMQDLQKQVEKLNKPKKSTAAKNKE